MEVSREYEYSSESFMPTYSSSNLYRYLSLSEVEDEIHEIVVEPRLFN